MKLAKGISTFLSLFIGFPIYMYLIYVCLSAAHADRLVWFLYWAHFPISLTVGVISRFVDDYAQDVRFEEWKKRTVRR